MFERIPRLPDCGRSRRQAPAPSPPAPSDGAFVGVGCVPLDVLLRGTARRSERAARPIRGWTAAIVDQRSGALLAAPVFAGPPSWGNLVGPILGALHAVGHRLVPLSHYHSRGTVWLERDVPGARALAAYLGTLGIDAGPPPTVFPHGRGHIERAMRTLSRAADDAFRARHPLGRWMWPRRR